MCVLLALSLPARALDEGKVVDLTYSFDSNTVYWPTAERFHLTPVHQGMTPGGYYYAANNFCAAEHGGTHMDAPAHFTENGLTAEALPAAALIGPAVVVDVSAKAATNPDYLLQVGDLEQWERTYGKVPAGAFVLMRSGWSQFWPDPKRYLGSDKRGDTTNLHFPGFSKEAVEWLLRERNIDAIGIDTASIDYGPSQDYAVHQVIGHAGKPAFENIANLGRLPARGATIIALPMKIGGGTGAPARVIAVLP